MGFQALFKREDVLSILRDTLSAYFCKRLGEEVYVGYEKRSDCMEFVLVPKLGMIMKPYPSKEICSHYYDSYNIRGNLIRNIGAKVLVFLALHSKNLLSIKERLYVSNNKYLNDKTIFSVCNRSVRIFDFENRYTVSIQKSTFTDKFFENQTTFRKQYKYDFVPPILELGEHWFSEEILPGKMLARITDQKKYISGENKALEYMRLIGKDTLHFQITSAYADSLLKKNLFLLEYAKKKKEIATYNFTKKYLYQITRIVQSCEIEVPLVLSHGDLQGGNVLVQDEKVWIIDWETNDNRSAWFDEFTLKYGTRYYGGIKKLIDDCKQDRVKCYSKEYFPCGLNTKCMIVVFLLEDMIFYLEDMLELPGKTGANSFDRYLNELREIDWEEVFS